MSELKDFEMAVLRQVHTEPLYTDQTGKFQSFTRLQQRFGGIDDDFARLKAALRKLHAKKCLGLIDENLVGGETDLYERYQITPLGEEALNKTAQVTNISGNSYSTIASNSPQTIQSINISQYSDDLKTKVKELKDAIEKRDHVTIKKIFGYILDKSVDLGVQILANGIGRMG
ncbi:MAG: hypothetical protein WED06_03345 [Candidatus Paceibacterota bacterium]